MSQSSLYGIKCDFTGGKTLWFLTNKASSQNKDILIGGFFYDK